MKTNIQSKLSQAYVKPLALGAFLVGLCLSGGSAQAYIISDSFDLTGGARVSGASLNGTTTMTGSATWVANSPVKFGCTATNGYLSFSAVDYGYAGVSLTSAATDTVTLQAAMHPHGESSWLGMRIGTTPGWSTTDGIFVLVNGSTSNNGMLQVFTNNFNLTNFSATTYGYDPNGPNQYSVEYNGTTNTLSLWANGVALITSQVLTPAQTPGVITYAGLLDCMNAANGASFDNFLVSVAPEISDSFDLTGGARVSGAPLDGTTTMTGNAMWAANWNCWFGDTGTDGYLSFPAVDYGYAGVGLTSAATDTVTLQAAMHPHGESSWLGMRIGTTPGWSTTDGIFVLVNGATSNNGFLQVFTNNFNLTNFPATAYGYDPNELNLYSVKYNGATNSLSLWANGVALITNQLLTPTQIPGVIGYAGLLDCANAANEASFDNFRVSAVPAPATLNLLPNSGFEVTTTEAMPDYWGPVFNSWGTAVDQWVLDTDSWRAHWGVDRTVNHTTGGMNALRIVSSVTNPPELRAVTNWIQLTANLTRTLSVWLRSDQPNLPVTIEVSGCTPSATTSVTTPPTPNSWQRYSLNISPTASSSMVFCSIYPTGNGTLWVDDVQLENGTVATQWQPSLTDSNIVAAVHKEVNPIGDHVVTPGGSTVTVSIDSYGRFLVEGQPFIPMAIGWAGLPSSAVLQHLAQAGFNTIVPSLSASCTIPDMRAFLDRAKENGLKVVACTERNVPIAMLQSWISSLKDHPAIIMWYVYDEPVTSAEWQDANDRYALAKATDPSRPAMVNAIPSTTYVDWMSDVLSADYYPVPVDVLGSICLFGDIIETLHQVAVTAGKPTWFWLQNMGYAYFCPREPTGAEAECMAYLSLIRGSRGIIYFFQKPRTVEQWDELRLLNHEVGTLTPVLSSTDTPPAVSADSPSIHVLSKRYDGRNYVIAVNESPLPVTAELTSSATGAVLAAVLFEDRDVSVVNGTITDTFAGYQRHVYKTVLDTQDIGNVGLAGSAGYSDGSFAVSGAGAGITGAADAFRFVYQSITGDCTVVARVASFASTVANARAGVMMRQSTATNAIEASSLFMPRSQRVYFHRRTSTGGSTSTSYSSATAAPYWVKLMRAGNTMKAYRSADGTSWTQVGSNTTVTMTNPILVGLAVTSGSMTGTKTGIFDNVTITQP